MGFTLLYRLPMPDNAVTRLKGSWLKGLTRTQKNRLMKKSFRKI
ncbi:hypothetical protein LTSERUB_3351 [Salmonella enterica subsp. enterica serovar Rubislaw str. A4-653]|uniref:Uncharacterized protein n=1 Tax=Salmonella enterica subsp. enterica serovar Rubislaw str. A4-653 TaxID=913081 RepID=G5QKX4_SALRU|nr:hypothetical protein LTSERUB_3351 [Salmonella enterica subsp. enterica serovar Rubislaw str. A4-653]